MRGLQVCEELSRTLGLHMFEPHVAAPASVRQTYSGDCGGIEARATVDRTATSSMSTASRIRVFELQGDIFFSSVETITRSVLEHVGDATWVIFDGRRLGFSDRPGAELLDALRRELEARGRGVVFAHLPLDAPVRVALERCGTPVDRFFADADLALEWCEDVLLHEYGAPEPYLPTNLADHELFEGLTADEATQLLDGVAREEFAAGSVVFEQGDAADRMFFVVVGEVSVRLHWRGQPRAEAADLVRPGCDLRRDRAARRRRALDGGAGRAGHGVLVARERDRRVAARRPPAPGRGAVPQPRHDALRPAPPRQRRDPSARPLIHRGNWRTAGWSAEASPAMTEKLVLVEKPQPHTSVVTLNRPERLNAMSIELVIELDDALRAVADDNDSYVVVLTGAGRGFCSGLDLKDYGDHPEHRRPAGRPHRAAVDAVLLAADPRRCAACPSRCSPRSTASRTAAGMCLSLAAEMRIAGESAEFNATGHRQRAHQHRARRELAAAAPRRRRALERHAAHRPQDRRRRRRCAWAWCRGSLPDDELLAEVLELAARMCEFSPYGLQMTKDIIWVNLENPSLEAAIEIEDRNQLMLGFTDNLPEAIRAFDRKRKPVYTDEPRKDLFSAPTRGVRTRSRIIGVNRHFPFPHPFGWFQVAYPEDLAPGRPPRCATGAPTSCSGATRAASSTSRTRTARTSARTSASAARCIGRDARVPVPRLDLRRRGQLREDPVLGQGEPQGALRTYPVVVRNGMVDGVAPPRRDRAAVGDPRDPRDGRRRVERAATGRAT